MALHQRRLPYGDTAQIELLRLLGLQLLQLLLIQVQLLRVLLIHVLLLQVLLQVLQVRGQNTTSDVDPALSLIHI